MKKIIGGGRELEGIYYLDHQLKFVAKAVAVHSDMPSLQRHYCPAHPSLRNVKLLIHSLRFIPV